MGLDERLDAVKRQCLLCHTYRTFKPEESANNQDLVLKEMDDLARYFKEQFDTLRKNDADSILIQKAQHNKTVCFDANSLCRQCNKQTDAARRHLNDLQL